MWPPFRVVEVPRQRRRSRLSLQALPRSQLLGAEAGVRGSPVDCGSLDDSTMCLAAAREVRVRLAALACDGVRVAIDKHPEAGAAGWPQVPKLRPTAK